MNRPDFDKLRVLVGPPELVALFQKIRAEFDAPTGPQSLIPATFYVLYCGVSETLLAPDALALRKWVVERNLGPDTLCRKVPARPSSDSLAQEWYDQFQVTYLSDLFAQEFSKYFLSSLYFPRLGWAVTLGLGWGWAFATAFPILLAVVTGLMLGFARGSAGDLSSLGSAALGLLCFAPLILLCARLARPILDHHGILHLLRLTGFVLAYPLAALFGFLIGPGDVGLDNSEEWKRRGPGLRRLLLALVGFPLLGLGVIVVASFCWGLALAMHSGGNK